MRTQSALIIAALAAAACSRTSQAPAEQSVNMVDMNSPPNAPAATSTSKLGTITIRNGAGYSDELLYNGEPLRPPINSGSLSIETTFLHPDRALYVVQNSSGFACPASFYVIEVTAAGAHATKEFGECNDEVKIAEIPGGLTLRIPGFVGRDSDEASLEAADRVTHFFTYRHGKVTEINVTAPPVRITPQWLVGTWAPVENLNFKADCQTNDLVRFN